MFRRDDKAPAVESSNPLSGYPAGSFVAGESRLTALAEAELERKRSMDIWTLLNYIVVYAAPLIYTLVMVTVCYLGSREYKNNHSRMAH